MSTRGLYNFGEGINVYVHSDNYPSGARDKITNALHLAWDLPRFEPDEFAAAFVAGNKPHGGGVRLMPTGRATAIAKKHCADVEYIYVIRAVDTVLYATVYNCLGMWTGKDPEKIFDGPVSKLRDLQEQIDREQMGAY